MHEQTMFPLLNEVTVGLDHTTYLRLIRTVWLSRQSSPSVDPRQDFRRQSNHFEWEWESSSFHSFHS